MKTTTLKCLLLTTAIFGAFLTTTPAMSQSMEDVVRLTLETNPTIGVVATNREAIEEELEQARGLYLPQVDLSVGVGPEHTSDSTTRGAGEDPEKLVRQDASLQIQQRVFSGFDTTYRVEREKARTESAARRVYENSEFIALDAIGAYLEVIRQRELFALSKQNVDFHANILAKLEQRLQGGVGTQADVSQTRGRLARAQATLSSTGNALGDAEALYTRIVGQYPGELMRPSIPVGALPQSMDQAVDMATLQNPTVKVSEADVDAADAEIGIATAAFYPNVNIEAESNYREDAGGIDTYEHDSNVLLRMRWNLFRGGIDRAARQEAVKRMHQARQERWESVVAANEEARRSWFSYQASAQQIQQLESAVLDLRDTRDSYQQQFEVGQRTLLDLLDAENELFTARGQLVSADINTIRSAYRLLASTGELLKTINIAPPDQAAPVNTTFGDTIALD